VTQPASALGEPLTVRRLSLADLPRVMEIERKSFSSPWSLAMFGLELSKPSGISLAALHGRRLVGYLVCSRYADVWHVMNIAVEPQLRRRGGAAAMLTALFERADRPGERYTLEVRPSNASAVAMYERFGFRSAGLRQGYYHDNREDALVMWRTVDE
jgi:[ribosomal protein S18]-alanine N-acetyltransferase